MSTKSGKTSGSKDRFIVEGTAYWAHLAERNRLSNKYQIDISIDSKMEKILESKGITIKESDKENDDRGRFVTLKSDYPPKLFDAKKKEIDIKTLIGNGSHVKVATHTYEWKFGRDKGTALGLDAVQVITLVSYKDNTTDLFSEEDGFEGDLNDMMDHDDEDTGKSPF